MSDPDPSATPQPQPTLRTWLLTATAGIAGFPGVAVLVAVLAATACACTAPVATPDVTSPVDGVIVSIDSGGLTDVRGFVLRVPGGASFDFVLGPLQNPTAFPPGHLAEHQATSAPVRVYFQIDGGRRVVYRLEDAVPVSPAPNPT